MTTAFAEQTRRWFAQTLGEPTPVQTAAWPQIAAGAHVLVSSPTGTGKTLCAFLVYLDDLLRRAQEGGLQDQLELIYISPLKSLAGDIRENLRRPLDGIGLEYGNMPGVRVAVRTGDTPQAERQRMGKKPPHILITTPESLFLLLSSQSGKNMLKTAKAVIIDELHALLGNKRGAHLALSLARLDDLCPGPLQRIGLSATLEDPQRAARWLAPEEIFIAAPDVKKAIDIKIIKPYITGLLPEGTVWPEIAAETLRQCEGCRTAIAFVDNRAAAERLAFFVNRIAGEGYALTHHGSISKEQRQLAEEQLRAGQLKLLVATSSMELGIDVGEIDKVLQVGCPMTISSMLQRLGRAGHRPGLVSEMAVFPRMAGEALYCALTAELARRGQLEPIEPPEGCLDILAQHLVSMAVGEEYAVEAVMPILRRAQPFAGLSQDDVRNTLEMLAGDHEHDRDIPVRPRLLYDRLSGTVRGDAWSRMLALSSGGTIPDRGYYTVKNEAGVKLGELDEECVFEARSGDKFMLGAFAWKVLHIGRDDVTVAPASREGAQMPFWKGESAGRHVKTGLAFGAMIREIVECPALLGVFGLDDASASDVRGILQRQLEATGALADDRTIVVERFSDEAGVHQMMVHCVLGRRVNEPLALLCREAARRRGYSLDAFVDDNGFLLLPRDGNEYPQNPLYSIDMEQAEEQLMAIMPATPAFGMLFRYNAAHALLMGAKGGSRAPLWIQRMRAAELLNGAVKIPGHPIVRECTRELLHEVWDLPSLRCVLAGIRSGQIEVREARTESPSPLSLPLRRQIEATMLYDYHPVGEAVQHHTADALDALRQNAAPPKALLEQAAGLRPPADEEQLHTLLMTSGDLVAGEAQIPYEWLDSLLRGGRVLYIEPGLWIAREEEGLYAAALEEQRGEALQRLLRRLLRYRGGQTIESICARYALPEESVLPPLEALAEEGLAVVYDEVYFHAQNVERAQQAHIRAQRSDVKTQPGSHYAAYLANRIRRSAPAAEQLEHALDELAGCAYPLPLWENVILPARVSGYHSGMLDTLLAQGAFCWTACGGAPSLRFYRRENLDYDNWPETEGLSRAEAEILEALRRQGASFAHTLPLLGDPGQTDALLALARRGLVTADTYAPVRYLLNEKKIESQQAKRRTMARVNVKLAGRWEALRPEKELPLEQRIDAAFARFVLLTRETAREANLPWAQALTLLRLMEYQGRTRRGYFIRELSGAQYVKAEDFTAFTAAMAVPRDDIVWLTAADPSQIIGKCLPGQSFMCLASTAVCLCAVEILAIMERSGTVLKVLDPARLPQCVQAFTRAFKARQIYAERHRIVVREYPPAAAQALAAAGFRRELGEFVLDR